MIRNLSALATFVCVARHMSFTKAASELYLTQGAVSVQIKQLEEELRFPLFHRKIRQIFLTREGKELLEIAEPMLEKVQARIEVIRSDKLEGALTVSTLASFAAKWLIPRIPLFQERHPGMDLRIHTSERPVDFFSEKIDCAIRYGLGPRIEQSRSKGLAIHLLADDYFFPVCSPRLVSEQTANEPSDIEKFPLLHDVGVQEGFNVTWKDWKEAMGLEKMDFERGLKYNQSDFVLQAAIAGQGAALARTTLVRDDLNNGLLVPLFDQRLKGTYSYYFVCPREYETKHKLRAFYDWISQTLLTEEKAESNR